MYKIKVSAVSYTNSKPFVYGLTRATDLTDMDLYLDIPSVCASKLIENQVDIGLVPVAALLQIPNYQIISPYCIGAIGAVDSVFIFSTKPITEIRTLTLDSHSRTSNNLSRVLLKNYWKREPAYLIDTAGDAFVQIGDRTFGEKHHYPFVYDLAEEWFNFTGLPFVFAVWASNKSIPENFTNSFNRALKSGLDGRLKIIPDLPEIPGFDYEDYLVNKVDYNLDEKKMEAMHMFHSYIKQL